MKLYMIKNWLREVDKTLPRAEWATALIERHFHPLQLGKRENGKPYSLHGSMFINWSHNERYLVVAMSTVGEIGVDIEKHVIPYDEALYGWVLHDEEKKKLAQGTSFAEIWTRKEAILKWTGEGLRDNLEEFNSYAVRAYIITLLIEDSCISICSQRQEPIALYYHF